MIKDNIVEVDNYWIEGFEMTIPSSMELSVSEGKFFNERSISNDNEVENVVDHDEYPAFSFDVVSDNELDVIYDIYLLEQPSKSGDFVHVDRTEIGLDTIASFEGEDTIKYMLASFLVPSNTVDLANVEIKVNRAVKNDEDTSK